MTVAVRSFAQINFGLYIGAARADGFHDLHGVPDDGPAVRSFVLGIVEYAF